MNVLKDIGLLTFRCIQACLRNPVYLFMGIGIPLIYLALFTPLLGTLVARGGLDADNILTLFVPGMLPIIAFSTGLFTGFGTIDELRSGIIERLRVTPASRFAILSGPVSSFHFNSYPFWLSSKYCWFTDFICFFIAPDTYHFIFWECSRCTHEE